jgi:hypothetical protein
MPQTDDPKGTPSEIRTPADDPAFILSEQFFRRKGMVALGQNLVAGTIVVEVLGKLQRFTGDTNSAGEFDPAPVGLIVYDADARGATMPMRYIYKGAGVDGDLVTFPEGVDDALRAKIVDYFRNDDGKDAYVVRVGPAIAFRFSA